MYLSKNKKVYISGGIEQKKELLSVSRKLKGRRFCVCSSWLYRKGWQFKEKETGEEELLQRKLATLDYYDISGCDVFLLVAAPMGKEDWLSYIELGLALAWQKPVVVIGEKDNQYLYLPSVTVYKEQQEALDKEFPYPEKVMLMMKKANHRGAEKRILKKKGVHRMNKWIKREPLYMDSIESEECKKGSWIPRAEFLKKIKDGLLTDEMGYAKAVREKKVALALLKPSQFPEVMPEHADGVLWFGRLD